MLQVINIEAEREKIRKFVVEAQSDIIDSTRTEKQIGAQLSYLATMQNPQVNRPYVRT